MSTVNLEDLGYAQAQSSDSLEDRAREAMGAIAGFPEKVSDEARVALFSGYTKRYAEKNPPKVYAVIGGHYVQPTPEQLAKKNIEKIEVSVAFALSFSTHEFGRLAKENPELRKIVETVRENVKDYCSNRLGDLKRKAKEIIRKAQGGQTRETLSFEQSAKNTFDAWEKSVKTKATRGDPSANPVKFKLAVAAFWKAYKG